MDHHTDEADFATEGGMLRELIASQESMVVITGDRHYQYVIEDPETGIREHATGPASDEHARGLGQATCGPSTATSTSSAASC